MEEKKESDYYSGLVQLITDPDLTAARVDAASGRDNKVVAREGRSLVDDDLSTTVENYCTVRISLYSSLDTTKNRETDKHAPGCRYCTEYYG